MIARDEALPSPMTGFTGFPSAGATDWTFLSAKRAAKLALEELRQDEALMAFLRANPAAPGRKAISGKKGDLVWDLIRLGEADSDAGHVAGPYLILGVQRRCVEVFITLPNAVGRRMRRRVADASRTDFDALLRALVEAMVPVWQHEPTAVPMARLLQRRYRRINDPAPHEDAVLSFDLRISVPGSSAVKHQPHWAEAARCALAERGSNLQLQVGVAFDADQS